MKSLLVGLVVSVFVLAACSSGGSSADSGTVAGEASGSTRGAGDSTPTTAPVPEETTPTTVLPDTSGAEGAYRNFMVGHLPAPISDETLDCFVESALGEADAEQLAEITEENFSEYLVVSRDLRPLVDTLFEDEDSSILAQVSVFGCMTDEEYRAFLIASAELEPDGADCITDQVGGKDAMVDLMIASERGDPEPPEFTAGLETCGID